MNDKTGQFHWNLQSNDEHDDSSTSLNGTDSVLLTSSNESVLGEDLSRDDVPWWSPESSGRRKYRDRMDFGLVVVVVGLVLIVGAFLVGRALPGFLTSNSASPFAAATSAHTPSPATVSWRDRPERHQWNTLKGGECFQSYVSPWEQEFMIVDCSVPHSAQLVKAAPWPAVPSAPFPGDKELAAEIGGLCGEKGIINQSAASHFTGLQVQGSYPATIEQWNAGERNYYCFVSRVSGEPLTGSLI